MKKRTYRITTGNLQPVYKPAGAVADIFVRTIKEVNGVDMVREFKFHDKRKWRFDYAIIEHKIAVEVEGGVWEYGRHNRASGFLKDMEKYNEAAAMGWKVLRITPQQMLTSYTIDLIERTIKNNLK